MKSRYVSFVVSLILSCHTVSIATAETVTWNVKSQYGITTTGINSAISDAKTHFKNAPNDRVVLEIDAGTYHLAENTKQEGTINLSKVKPGPGGRLVITGKGIDKTILIFDDKNHAIVGRGTYRVTMSNMHMTRAKYTVSQGHVVSTSPGKIILQIQPGFPTPHDIFNSKSAQGRYLRQYKTSKTDPQLIQEHNQQIAWKSAKHLKGNLWEINLSPSKLIAPYPKGALIGIKSKHGGQTYWMMGGSDFIFDHVKWTHKTRGVFRGTFDKIQILNCITDRAPAINGQTPCLASPGGGPQIGQPWDKPISGNMVKNCRFIGSGDDAVAFFHAQGSITGCYIQDAFARGILLANSPNVITEGNKLVRNPIQRSKDHRLPGSTAPPINPHKKR